MDSSSSLLDKQILLSDRDSSSPQHVEASPTASADKNSSSTFSEDQYNDASVVHEIERAHSTTPRIRAMSDVRLAMSSILDNNGGPNSNRFPSCDLVRAAIHHLGDLFCDFNESLSANSVLRKNSSNLSYKEHENESMDATTFIAFIEDKFHIYGYTVQEINQLFITLRPQTPLHISSRNTHKQHRSLTIHFTEFNVVIHQMYTAKFKSILSEKTSYQQHHIHRLLLDSISHQLQTVRKALEASRNGNGGVLRSPISNASGPEVPPPINMNDLLAKHKMQQERLRQKIRDDAMDEREDDDAILHSSPMDASSPIFGGMTMSPVGIKVVGARPIGISNREMMDMVDTPVSNFHSEEETLLREEDEEDLESYDDDLDDTDEDEDDDDDDDDDLEDTDDDDLGLTYGIDDIMQEIEHEIEAHIQVGTHIQFSESGVVIQCANINREHHFYEFHTPQTLLQDSDPFTLSHLYRLQSARSDDTDLSSMFAPSTTGAASPLSILSSSAMLVSKDNPFKIASEPNDSVYRRQEYMYQLSQFFGANVYLTTQQLRFVDIDPKLPDFMSNEEPSLHMLHRPISASNQSNDTRHRSGNIRDVAQINTEQPTKKGGKAAKVNENKDLYDEDKKLAGLLQSRSSLHYDYVPNGLLTHRQFIEFIDSLYISNYDENVLKHMFRYIYTEELPPILPPPVVIEFDQGQEDNYNNVNGMYVAYSECIGYEYDEVMDLIADNADKQSFDDLVTTMVMERLQNIYQTLKFDDLDAHPNQFLHREQSFHRQQETDKLDGDELKENVYNYFTEQNIKNNITHRQSLTQNTQVSTMRSTASDTVTFNGMFRRSIISHESLGNMLESMKKDKQDKTPKLVHQVSSSTTTLTLHPPRTPVSPGTTPSHLDTFDKYPALIDITDIPHQYHHRIHSLQSKLMKKASLNALIDDDQTYKSSTTDLHKPPTHNGVSRSTAASPSIGNITVLTNVANMDNFTPKEGSDDDHDLITQLNEMKDNNDNNLPPVFVNSSSNDSNEIVSPNGTKRKKVHRQHSASRQPSLPTLPEEHIDANHNSNSAAHGQPSVDARAKKRLKNIDGRVDQLFATIGSDQVHIHLLKYGLRLIEVSLHGDEHYFLQILQTYANHKYNSHSPQRFFVHKDWIKQFLYDDNIPHRLKSLQRKIINNLRRKSHLLVSELSRRSSYGTTSTYPSNASSEDTFTNRATHNSTEPMLHALPREVQQTYVAYFKQTLKSRAKALTQYTQTRYPPTHKKHWRDVFLFMSDGENYLDRVTFKEGIERCGIKIRTQKKSGKQKRNKIEIQQILNAVFVEMDFDNTGYVTIHAFTNMMMAVDPPIASTQSSTAYHSNRNSHNVYDVYSNYGISDSATNPRKSYEMQQRVAGAPQYNYNATHGQYLSPQHATQQHMPRPYSHGQHLSPFDAKYHNNNNYHTQPQQRQSKKRRKKKKKSRHHHHSSNKGHDHTYDLSDLSSQEEREPPHIQQYYPEDEDDIVEEKTMATHEDDAYLNRTWNGDVMDEYNPHVHHSHHKKYSHHREEEQDEKIPMLDVLNQHERQMKGANQSKDTQQLELEEVQQKKKGKKKMKKKKKGTNEPNYSFIVSRRKLSALDLIIRRYYMTIDASKGCVVLSPLSDCISEVSMEFGLHQIIVGDHQSTMIRVKTLNGKDIYYEFDVRQAKDEFVDLLDDVKQKSGSNNFNSPHILPRGIGFGADHSIGDIQHQLQLNVHVHSMFDDDDIDVDPIYDDECAVCRATLCNCSTLYWFVLLSCAHLLMIYLYTQTENAVIDEEMIILWILFNMICLRVCAIQWIRTKCILLCTKMFDCIWCHRFAYYGFSAHSLITIWCIVWLTWNTMNIGLRIWTHSDNTPQQIICFGFIVLSLTFVVFAQCAYCRCRCCSVTLSHLLHTVLARLACCFLGIYGVLYCNMNSVSSSTLVLLFWVFSLVLIYDFVFYFIFVCLLSKNQSKIDAKHIGIRVLSDEQCEVQIPLKVSSFEYILMSDDGATWIKLPILLTTNKKENNDTLQHHHQQYPLKMRHAVKNVERNPYHLPDTSSNEHEQVDQVSEFYKLKHTLTRSTRNNQYEAVGQGRAGHGGFIGSSIDEDDAFEEEIHKKNDLCSVMIHSRNKIGQRMIETASHCFEEPDFALYIEKYDRALSIMCFAVVYKRIGIIATDDRVIPAIAYLESGAPILQYIDLVWIANKPKKQYHNLYQLLQSNKHKNNRKRNIKIVDMTKKKSSKEKHIASFINNISSQAIFALTSRHQGERIQKESKHAVVYIQHTEWY